MTLPFRYNTPEERFAAEIAALQAAIRDLQQRPFRIPILDADPSPDYPGNAWMLNDGRLHIRNADGVIKEFTPVTSTGGSTGGGTEKPPPAPVTKTYTTEWTATWSQTYKGNGAQRTDNNHLYYGNGDSYNDRQHGVFGFNSASISSALSGATIKKVEIFLYNGHAWYNNGADIYLSAHNNTSAPGSYGSVNITASRIYKVHYGKPEQGWRTITNQFGTMFRSGSAKGMVLDPPGDSNQYYGWAGGVGDSYPAPKLRITYVK